jgi:hypothetical protein
MAKTRTQDDGESVQEISTAVEQLKDYVRTGTGKAFCNGVRERGVTQHLHLGCKRTLSEVLR